MSTRREFLSYLTRSGIVLGCMGPISCHVFSTTNSLSFRRYHVSMQPEAWINNPELLNILKSAGVSDIWMASFLQGRWYHTAKELKEAADYLISEGFNPHVLSVPLGHPGNALDPADEALSESKENWKNACTHKGELYSGTSIHPPVVEENIEAVRLLAEKGHDILFLDDDFRLAKFPGLIGGCFCDTCKKEFLNSFDYSPADWELLLESVENRNPSKVLRSWIDYICEKEHKMFVALQNAAPTMEIGIMVMYLGAEKAGIALDKYQDVPFRVGELMFDDKSFGRVKGKTDELFSSLFHRRFVKPELAYSETTTYPSDALSAKNMAAKLTISLVSDVRNTMFMSGLKPFHVDYWETLAPAMKKSAQFHHEIAGHVPKGPFKHFWGWGSRLVGEDRPFSLFLASGIPFEVVEEISMDGWVFLSNEDAQLAVDEKNTGKKQNLIVRPEAGIKGDRFLAMNESLDDIFTFKNRIIPLLKGIPFVKGDTPVIFAWYPSAKKALLWNVEENKHTYTIMRDDQVIQTVTVDALDVALVHDL